MDEEVLVAAVSLRSSVVMIVNTLKFVKELSAISMEVLMHFMYIRVLLMESMSMD